MKRFEVLTLFPGLIAPFAKEGLIGKACASGLLAVEVIDYRAYGLGRHRAVDDVPYGGGAGMVLRPEPLFQAVRERSALNRSAGRRTRVVLLTPQGRRFEQQTARELAAREEVLLLICGRYEGFDERIRLALADDEISLGDFVLLGGEVGAMAVIEAVARLVPGVLGNPDSSAEESFAWGRLEYPHYTRPASYEGMDVPPVLLSGNHGEIRRWRNAQAHQRTRRRRPDLVADETAAAGENETDGETVDGA